MQAHLKADKYYSVIANMRGTSPEDVATRILSCEALRGLQVLPCLSMPILACSKIIEARYGFSEAV